MEYQQREQGATLAMLLYIYGRKKDGVQDALIGSDKGEACSCLGKRSTEQA